MLMSTPSELSSSAVNHFVIYNNTTYILALFYLQLYHLHITIVLSKIISLTYYHGVIYNYITYLSPLRYLQLHRLYIDNGINYNYITYILPLCYQQITSVLSTIMSLTYYHCVIYNYIIYILALCYLQLYHLHIDIVLSTIILFT